MGERTPSEAIEEPTNPNAMIKEARMREFFFIFFL
jgi:hypothetical protein